MYRSIDLKFCAPTAPHRPAGRVPPPAHRFTPERAQARPHGWPRRRSRRPRVPNRSADREPPAGHHVGPDDEDAVPGSGDHRLGTVVGPRAVGRIRLVGQPPGEHAPRGVSPLVDHVHLESHQMTRDHAGEEALGQSDPDLAVQPPEVHRHDDGGALARDGKAPVANLLGGQRQEATALRRLEDLRAALDQSTWPHVDRVVPIRLGPFDSWPRTEPGARPPPPGRGVGAAPNRYFAPTTVTIGSELHAVAGIELNLRTVTDVEVDSTAKSATQVSCVGYALRSLLLVALATSITFPVVFFAARHGVTRYPTSVPRPPNSPSP